MTTQTKLPSYANLVQRLREVAKVEVPISDLEQFERPTASAESPIEIRPHFRCYSARTSNTYLVEFHLGSALSGHYDIRVQRMFDDRSDHGLIVRLALNALVKQCENPNRDKLYVDTSEPLDATSHQPLPPTIFDFNVV